jgi:hypothetical protein
MMGSVPPLPPILIWVPVIAVARVVLAIVIRPFLLVCRADVDAESVICFGLGGGQGNQPERCQSQEEKSFHIGKNPTLTYARGSRLIVWVAFWTLPVMTSMRSPLKIHCIRLSQAMAPRQAKVLQGVILQRGIGTK